MKQREIIRLQILTFKTITSIEIEIFLLECQGDPTYLIVENDRTLATYGINAVCTHLGCVVPWNKAENKFICPCHGSQYNSQGKVVRGPAPLVSEYHCYLHGSFLLNNLVRTNVWITSIANFPGQWNLFHREIEERILMNLKFLSMCARISCWS